MKDPKCILTAWKHFRGIKQGQVDQKNLLGFIADIEIIMKENSKLSKKDLRNFLSVDRWPAKLVQDAFPDTVTSNAAADSAESKCAAVLL